LNAYEIKITIKGATREGLKGLKPPLAKSKLRKKKEFLIFSRFRAYNPIKMLLKHYYILPVM